MTIRINNCDYEILEINRFDDALVIGETRRVATIHYDTCKIYIADYLSEEMKYNSLLHELTHAFIYIHAMLGVKKFNQEAVCEFMACFGKQIVTLADSYFEQKKLNEDAK